MDKIKELFEKMVNITFQAQAQGEIGMATGKRIDEVVAEYEEYCNQQEKEKLVAETKDQVDSLCRGLRDNDLEKAIRHLRKVDEYLDEIEKYN